MSRIKLFLFFLIFVAMYFVIFFKDGYTQKDSVIVGLMRVYYHDGEKVVTGMTTSTIYLTKEYIPYNDFRPSLTFGITGAKEVDYRTGACGSDFRNYFDLKNLIKSSPFETPIENIRIEPPLLIYNFLIKPERLTTEKIHVKLAYEKNEFINFSTNNNPIYEKSLVKQEFDVNFEEPRELFVVSTAPYKMTAEIVVQHPIRPLIESKISTGILEKLTTLKSIEIPITFHIEYVRKDKSNGKILFRKETDQQGYNRENPFSLDFLVESPDVYRQNGIELNYTIRGYLVPLEQKQDELKLFLIMEQMLGTPAGSVGQGINKDFSIKKGEKLEIELLTSSGIHGFQSKSGEYIRFNYAELFQGCTESLFLTADF